MLPPRTRLFLSVDITGSTAYKQDLTRGTHEYEGDQSFVLWPDLFVSFFHDFPDVVYTELDTAHQKYSTKSIPDYPEDPVLWKAIGDELIFYVSVTCELHIAAAVVAWIEAVERFRKETLKDFPVNLKAAAWVATFPYPNREIAIPLRRGPLDATTSVETSPSVRAARAYSQGEATGRNEAIVRTYEPGDLNYVLDFVGPSVDLGFRLSSLATPRKMVISAKTAEVLADQCLPASSELFSIYYEHPIELKGIGGESYPWFWLDAMPGDPFYVAEDKASGRRPVESATLRNLVELWLGKLGWEPCYLPNSNDGRYSSLSDEMIRVQEGIEEVYERSRIAQVPEESPQTKPSANAKRERLQTVEALKKRFEDSPGQSE